MVAEGRGPDFILEVLHLGDRKKDLVKNVERYARLGVEEYFVYDRSGCRGRRRRRLSTTSSRRRGGDSANAPSRPVLDAPRLLDGLVDRGLDGGDAELAGDRVGELAPLPDAVGEHLAEQRDLA